jgi:DNA polymerase III alpha subunit
MIARLSGDVINKKSLEALIHSGCLDRFENRRTLIEAMPQILAYHKEFQKKQSNSQV